MEDFNIPSEERVALLKRLQDTIGDVPPHFWAACQVCHVEALERWVEIARISPNVVYICAGQIHTITKYWGPYPLSTPNQQTPSNLSSSPIIRTPPAKKQKTSHSPGDNLASSPLNRCKLASVLASQRDNSCCVLTGVDRTEVAHIYPFHSIRHKEEDMFGLRHTFWSHLKNFWPAEKVAAWEAELFPKGMHEVGEERVYNLITLSPDAHVRWAAGDFALKPIYLSDDKITLKVQFFWQKEQDTQTTMSLLTAPFPTKGLDHHHNSGLTNWRTKQTIKSGDYFDLQTTDPTTKPLPSFQLLEMQWFLQRVLGMTGGAGDVSWEDLREDPENPDYTIAGFAYGEDEDEDEEISYYDMASAAYGEDEEEEEEIPSLDLDEEVQDSSLVSAGLSPSLDFSHKDMVHLHDPDRPKHHTEKESETETEHK